MNNPYATGLIFRGKAHDAGAHLRFRQPGIHMDGLVRAWSGPWRRARHDALLSDMACCWRGKQKHYNGCVHVHSRCLRRTDSRYRREPELQTGALVVPELKWGIGRQQDKPVDSDGV